MSELQTLRELEKAVRSLYTKLAQTHSGDKAKQEGWLDEWDGVMRALAALERTRQFDSKHPGGARFIPTRAPYSGQAAYDPLDPKSPDYYGSRVDWADAERKRRKEEGE